MELDRSGTFDTMSCFPTFEGVEFSTVVFPYFGKRPKLNLVRSSQCDPVLGFHWQDAPAHPHRCGDGSIKKWSRNIIIQSFFTPRPAEKGLIDKCQHIMTKKQSPGTVNFITQITPGQRSRRKSVVLNSKEKPKNGSRIFLSSYRRSHRYPLRIWPPCISRTRKNTWSR